MPRRVWRQSGGSYGSIQGTKHKLVVTANRPNRLRVAGILQMLRDDPRQPQTTDAGSAARVR